MKNYNLIHKKFNQKIILQKSVKTPDGAGGFAITWNDYLTLWANVKPISISSNLSENFAFQQINSISQYKITIRYRNDVNNEMRILVKDKPLNIKEVINNDFDNEILIIKATSGA